LAREVYAIEGRLILIDSILNNTPLYMMSFYSLPKKVKKTFGLLWGQITLGRTLVLRNTTFGPMAGSLFPKRMWWL
jgi:hypothetical protein